jgi:hypothetical protein
MPPNKPLWTAFRCEAVGNKPLKNGGYYRFNRFYRFKKKSVEKLKVRRPMTFPVFFLARFGRSGKAVEAVISKRSHELRSDRSNPEAVGRTGLFTRNGLRRQ